MSNRNQYCTFFLDGHCFGVEVERVQEIIRYQEMTHVPLAPALVGGLINLRGQIVTAIDLRRRLGLPDAPSDRLPMNVVLRTTDGAVSLLVDEIGEVQQVDDEAFENLPETVRGVGSELIRGAYKLQNHLLLVLDSEKAMNFSSENTDS